MEDIIKSAWEQRTNPDLFKDTKIKDAVFQSLEALEKGDIRVCEKKNDQWIIQHWVKQAALLYFKMMNSQIIPAEPAPFFDKIPLKFTGWTQKDFQDANIRCAPGSIVRKGTYIESNVVIMPNTFVNVGAWIGENTMIDTGARVGSCAQVGKNCHLGGGVGLGGVFEPISAYPVIIEDHCFIGAMSHVSEGVIVGEGSVLGVGVHITGSSKIIDRNTGNITIGHVPPGSVIVPGSFETKGSVTGLHTACAVIVKKVTPETREKTSLNELLRN